MVWDGFPDDLETDSEAEGDDKVSKDPTRPWKAKFDQYLDTHEIWFL